MIDTHLHTLNTAGLETDPSAVFFPVNKILKYTTHLPVTVKVSAEYVQIMTVRKQEIFYGLNAITNDVCHISEIEDIATSHHERSSLDSTQDFSYKCTRENIVLTFNSPKKEAIINVSTNKSVLGGAPISLYEFA